MLSSNQNVFHHVASCILLKSRTFSCTGSVSSKSLHPLVDNPKIFLSLFLLPPLIFTPHPNEKTYSIRYSCPLHFEYSKPPLTAHPQLLHLLFYNIISFAIHSTRTPQLFISRSVSTRSDPLRYQQWKALLLHHNNRSRLLPSLATSQVSNLNSNWN